MLVYTIKQIMICNPGQLAFITHDDSLDKSAIGSIVEIVEQMATSTPFSDGAYSYFTEFPNLGSVWHVKSLSKGIPFKFGETVEYIEDAIWPEKWLKPFEPVDLTIVEDLFSSTLKLEQKEIETAYIDMDRAKKTFNEIKIVDIPIVLQKMKEEGQIYDYSLLTNGFKLRFSEDGPSIFYLSI